MIDTLPRWQLGTMTRRKRVRARLLYNRKRRDLLHHSRALERKLAREGALQDGPSKWDPEGRPMGLGAWLVRFELGPRVLALDLVNVHPEQVRVSTVWLGIDHGYGFLRPHGREFGPPLIFETMVFGGAHDGYSDRYSSQPDALNGHRHALKLVRGEVSE